MDCLQILYILLDRLGGHRRHDRMQPVPITTNVVSSNPAHGELYSIQHYVI